jgi:KaiC/GvpD/RAD55 family RecA-like ATPase
MAEKRSLKPQELHIENEQKIISFLLKVDSQEALLIPENHFLNKDLRLVFRSIKELVKNGIKIELDIVLDQIKKTNQNFTYNDLKLIHDFFEDFDNIQVVKERLKQNYFKQIEVKEKIEKLLVIANESSDIDLKDIQKLNLGLSDALIEIQGDENNLLFFSDLVEKYKDVLNKRDAGFKRTFGVHWLDKQIMYIAEPGDMMSIAMRKGEGKTTLALNLANAQINNNIPVIYFSFDMGWVTVMDRWLSLREGFLKEELMQEGRSREQEKKINNSLKSMQDINNFIFYPAATLSLDELDSYLYKAKNEFRKKGVLKGDDEYCILYFDTLDMVEDFSGTDAYAIKAGINKFHNILRKQKCFSVNLLQLNENTVRSKKPKDMEAAKKLRFTKEDIEGGASYSSRSRVVLIGVRPKAMMKSFFPDESELIDLEEDILNLYIDKQNDGNTGKIQPLIFDSFLYRIFAKKE